MRILLTAMDAALRDAWAKHCGGLEDVEVRLGSILAEPCDAVVSPANSFGFMDGGIDLLYSRHFGRRIQDRLQQLIVDHHHGELPVGSAEIVETDDDRIPFLIAAPTMRVPMILTRSVAPYLAARAVLLLIEHGELRSGKRRGARVRDAVRTVAFPGLGTGVGRVPPDICARQVRAAIEDVRGRIPFPSSWLEAQTRHQLLFDDRARDLQYPDP